MSPVIVYMATALLAGANAQYFNTYRKYEMAPYEVDPSTMGKSYELRYYKPQKWVSTTAGPGPLYAGSVAFGRLYKYIGGDNLDRREVRMTAPVLTRVDVNPYGGESSTYERSFYIPTVLQRNPPRPASRDVYIQTIGPMFAYVKTYTGWRNKDLRSQMYKQLKAELRRDGRYFDETMYLSAGYNSPLEGGTRTNEIWIIAKPK